MWNIIEGPIEVAPIADHRRFLCVIEKGEKRQEVYAEISGTAAACNPRTLPSPVDEMVVTEGRAAVERYLADDDPPGVIQIHTLGWRPVVAA